MVTLLYPYQSLKRIFLSFLPWEPGGIPGVKFYKIGTHLIITPRSFWLLVVHIQLPEILFLPTPVFLPGESPWTEEPGRLQSTGWQRVRYNW